MPTIRITIDGDDRQTVRVVEALSALDGVEVQVRDAREDAEAAAFLDRLGCCGPVTPVVEHAGLLLTAPSAAEALLAVRRASPLLVG